MSTRHPGFNWIVSPTMDWHEPAPHAYHWAAYEPDGTRHHGYAPTEQQAKQHAIAVLTQPT